MAERAPEAVFERFGKSAVVLEPVQDRYVRLNATGTLLWDALERPAPCGELAAVLARETGVAAQRAQADAAAFLGVLAAKGLVTLTPPGPQPG